LILTFLNVFAGVLPHSPPPPEDSRAVIETRDIYILRVIEIDTQIDNWPLENIEI
jgi:hypothetical protein